jgi:hypothetical protein
MRFQLTSGRKRGPERNHSTRKKRQKLHKVSKATLSQAEYHQRKRGKTVSYLCALNSMNNLFGACIEHSDVFNTRTGLYCFDIFVSWFNTHTTFLLQKHIFPNRKHISAEDLATVTQLHPTCVICIKPDPLDTTSMYHMIACRDKCCIWPFKYYTK